MNKEKLLHCFKRSTLVLSLIFSLTINEAANAIEDVPVKKVVKQKVTIDQIDRSNFVDKAILQSLNKITAKTQKLEIEVGKEIEFGKLDILIHKCWKAPLYKEPENKILIEIFQRNNDKEERERLFYGWMLSSSPSLSGLEHPIYDITALECTKNKK